MNLKERPYLRRIELLRERITSFNEYPFNLPIIKDFSYIDFHQDVTFFVGENGVGKSTIIESIAVGLGYNAEGGNRNVNFKTKETTSELYKFLRLIKSYKKPREGYFLRAESLYNVASYMDSIAPPEVQGYGGKSLHSQSHGEAFLSVIKNKFHGNGLYILDEPESALSPTRLIAILSVINNLVKRNSQFIIATHSPILLAYPNSTIYQINNSEIKEIEYLDTENFLITKNFLDNHKAIIDSLFSKKPIGGTHEDKH